MTTDRAFPGNGLPFVRYHSAKGAPKARFGLRALTRHSDGEFKESAFSITRNAQGNPGKPADDAGRSLDAINSNGRDQAMEGSSCGALQSAS